MKKRRIKMTILIIVPVIAHLLGVLSSISAVMTTRTSQGAIAWVISLNTFPYIALPAYWIFGRSKFEGYQSAKKANDDNVQSGLQKVIDGLAPYRADLSEAGGGGLAAERLADLPFLRDNRVDLLVDGEATFDSILAGIDAAKEYVLFQFYIIHDDEIGRKVKTHLLKKAAEGVKVYFLYDEIGSHELPDAYKNELREAGCQVFPFNTRKGNRNRFQLNFRNHRKIVVVDGHTSWVGGHNVGDEYLGKDPKFGHWRDTHVRIAGPAALAPQLAFVEDWHWATDEILSDLNWAPAEVDGGDKLVLVVASGPADDYETASLMFLHAINSAQKRIWIASPYFVPDDAIVSALQLAGLRGVDVRILIPDEPDHLLVFLAAFSYFDDAGLTGVKFFRYTDGFLHEKAMLIDDQLATVGTANFDNRSFRLNFEITALVADKDFAAEVEQMFLDDFEHSREMAENEVDEKSFWFRLSSRLARLTAPIL
jgi:cardiolipin synthase